jgi:hypothetical protein
VQAECQAVRIVGQIDRGADAVPGNILPPEPAPAQRGMIFRNAIIFLKNWKMSLLDWS